MYLDPSDQFHFVNFIKFLSDLILSYPLKDKANRVQNQTIKINHHAYVISTACNTLLHEFSSASQDKEL